MLTGEYLNFTVELKSGYNRVSIPDGAIGIDDKRVPLESGRDVLEYLEDNARGAHSIGLDRYICDVTDGEIERTGEPRGKASTST